MLIEVGGYDGKPLWIESSKVVGISAKPPAMCVVNMACGEQTEEWQLCDNVDRVRRAVDEANAGAVPRRGSDVGTSPLLGLKSEGA